MYCSNSNIMIFRKVQSAKYLKKVNFLAKIIIYYWMQYNRDLHGHNRKLWTPNRDLYRNSDLRKYISQVINLSFIRHYQFKISSPGFK